MDRTATYTTPRGDTGRVPVRSTPPAHLQGYWPSFIPKCFAEDTICAYSGETIPKGTWCLWVNRGGPVTIISATERAIAARNEI